MSNSVTDTRGRTIRRSLDVAALDGSTVVFEGAGTCDLLVDCDTLRDIQSVVASWAADIGMPTLLYSEAGGVRAKNAPGGPVARVPPGIDVTTPFTVGLDLILDSVTRGGEKTVIVLPFAESQLPDDHGARFGADAARILEQLVVRATDPSWRAEGHRIVLVGRTGSVDRRVTRMPGVVAVSLGLPGLGEREVAFDLMQHSSRHPLFLDRALPASQAARLAGGLTIDDISRLRYRSSPAYPLGVDEILDRKRHVLRQMAGNTLVVIENPPDLETDVAGLLQIRVHVAELLEDGDLNARILLYGPPGCGKTWVARTIARALRVPAIELARIKGRFVGESEDNLRRAFDAIKANLPACLILDEVDQDVFAKRSDQPADGNSVDSDLRAMFFEFLGDVGDQSGLSVIGMSNRPDLLDEASSDRFAKIPILYADVTEAAEIMAIQARRERRELAVDAAAEALAAAGDAFSGRQLVRLLRSARIHARQQGRTRIDGDDVAWAIHDTQERIGPGEERMALMAVAATSYSRHLPWNAARHFGDRFARPPKYLEAFVSGDGTVDLIALRARIREMEHHAR